MMLTAKATTFHLGGRIIMANAKHMANGVDNI
jgi:hypothetical protein